MLELTPEAVLRLILRFGDAEADIKRYLNHSFLRR